MSKDRRQTLTETMTPIDPRETDAALNSNSLSSLFKTINSPSAFTIWISLICRYKEY